MIEEDDEAKATPTIVFGKASWEALSYATLCFKAYSGHFLVVGEARVSDDRVFKGSFGQHMIKFAKLVGRK